MAGLVLSLKPNEKFLVNGALLSNGPKRGQICVSGDNVNVLRMSDVIHPDNINTPIRRVYYAAQIILSGDDGAINIGSEISDGLKALSYVFEDTVFVKNVRRAQRAASNGHYYSVLCALKPLLKIEREMLEFPLSVDCTLEEPKALSA